MPALDALVGTGVGADIGCRGRGAAVFTAAVAVRSLADVWVSARASTRYEDLGFEALAADTGWGTVMCAGGCMLTEALAALASAGGTALVTAMVTDGWEEVKERFARLLGHGKAKEVAAATARLEQSRAAITEVSGPDLERARTEQQVVWRTRLGDLLEQDPAVEGELRVLLGEVQAKLAGSSGLMQQQAAAYDQAQQAVLGHGVQNVRFGDQRGPHVGG